MNAASFVWKDTIRRPGELALILLGIAFGIAGIFILFSLRIGIEQTLFEAAQKKNPLSEITVYGGSGGTFLKLLGALPQKTLNDETLADFKNISSVLSVSPQMVYQNLASIEVEVLGQTLQTDSLIFGVEKNILAQDIPEDSMWKFSGDRVPVVISRKLMDFYNLSLAPGAGLPVLSESMFKGKTLTIMPGYSSFFTHSEKPKKILTGEVVGFSDRVDLVGVTIPLEAVKELNRSEQVTENTYQKIFVTLDSPRSVETVSKELESQGYRVSSLQKEFAEVGRSISYVEIILYIVSGIILAIAVALIGSSFWSSLLRRSRELGILRAVGARRQTLALLFIGEAALAGFFGGILGIGLGGAAIQIFKRLLSQTISLSSISIETIFSTPPSLMLILIIASPLLGILAASFPIFGTFRQPPKSLFVK